MVRIAMHILHCPFEILDQLALGLEDPHDLLSLSLTCKTWKRIILPSHIEFRYIRCTLNELWLWKLLSQKQYLASGVRRLAILSPANSAMNMSVPRSTQIIAQTQDITLTKLTEEEKTAAIKCITRAIKYMVHLQEFCWDDSVCFNDDIYSQMDLLQVLGDCRSINRVQLPSFKKSVSRPMVDTLAGFCCLTSLQLCVEGDSSDVTLLSVLLERIVKNNILLDDLGLHSTHRSNIPEFYCSVRLPHLQRLSITGNVYIFDRYLTTQSRSQMFTTFLTRHHNLKYLRLTGPTAAPIAPTIVESLPPLCSIQLPTYSCNPTVIPFSIATGLTHIATANLREEHDPKADIFRILEEAKALRSIVARLSEWKSLKKLVAMNPLLEKVYFTPDLEQWGYAVDNMFFCQHLGIDNGIWQVTSPEAAKPILSLLAELPHLTHVGGLNILVQAPFDGLDAILQHLSGHTKLLYMEVWDLTQTAKLNCLEVERNEDGSYKGWKLVDSVRPFRYGGWGGLFDGLA